MTIISKTTFTFTVLHRTDEPFTEGLTEAMGRSMDGHAVGWETGEVTEPVPDERVADELGELANDGEFFDSDLNEETDVCRHCGHGIREEDGTWIAPDAGFDVEGGDGIWRDSCPDNHESREAPHEPQIICERCSGPWGGDETCERCTYEDGTQRPLTDKGPLGPGAQPQQRVHITYTRGDGRTMTFEADFDKAVWDAVMLTGDTGGSDADLDAYDAEANRIVLAHDPTCATLGWETNEIDPSGPFKGERDAGLEDDLRLIRKFDPEEQR